MGEAESFSEPYYNGWPGDNRGWMRFASPEDARDFYRFSEGMVSFEEYRAMKQSGPRFEHVQIDLDAQGNFAQAIEARSVKTEGLDPKDESAVSEGNAP